MSLSDALLAHADALFAQVAKDAGSPTGLMAGVVSFLDLA